MNVIVSNASERPIYEQIYEQIKGAILRGECGGRRGVAVHPRAGKGTAP